MVFSLPAASLVFPLFDWKVCTSVKFRGRSPLTKDTLKIIDAPTLFPDDFFLTSGDSKQVVVDAFGFSTITFVYFGIQKQQKSLLIKSGNGVEALIFDLLIGAKAEGELTDFATILRDEHRLTEVVNAHRRTICMFEIHKDTLIKAIVKRNTTSGKALVTVTPDGHISIEDDPKTDSLTAEEVKELYEMVEKVPKSTHRIQHSGDTTGHTWVSDTEQLPAARYLGKHKHVDGGVERLHFDLKSVKQEGAHLHMVTEHKPHPKKGEAPRPPIEDHIRVKDYFIRVDPEDPFSYSSTNPSVKSQSPAPLIFNGIPYEVRRYGDEEYGLRAILAADSKEVEQIQVSKHTLMTACREIALTGVAGWQDAVFSSVGLLSVGYVRITLNGLLDSILVFMNDEEEGISIGNLRVLLAERKIGILRRFA